MRNLCSSDASGMMWKDCSVIYYIQIFTVHNKTHFLVSMC